MKKKSIMLDEDIHKKIKAIALKENSTMQNVIKDMLVKEIEIREEHIKDLKKLLNIINE